MSKTNKPIALDERNVLNDSNKQTSTILESKPKVYNISNYLIQNSFIDALDANGCWRIARVLKKTGDLIKVTFEGWSHRWDEV